jgi:hypothetical protein
MDLLGKKKFTSDVALKPAALLAPEEGSTALGPVQADAKMIRSACENNLVMSLALLSNAEIYKTLVIMSAVADSLSNWIGHAQKAMKDSYMCYTWLVTELATCFQSHQWLMIAVLADQTMLRMLGAFDFVPIGTGEELDGTISLDDSYARLAGQYLLALLSCRARRLAYVSTGYPGALHRAMVDDDLAKIVIATFQHHCDIYTKLLLEVAGNSDLKRILDRSPFHSVTWLIFLLNHIIHKSIFF